MSDYPKMINNHWVNSPLTHAALYATRGDRDRETHVSVPVELLRRLSQFRECGAKQVFTHDEDGALNIPFEASCRQEQGHSNSTNLEHVRTHSNGYYSWLP